MKTLCYVDSNISALLFSDDTQVEITDTNTIVEFTPKLIVSDMNVNTAVMYLNVDAPPDWVSAKYLFDGASWTLNPLQPIPAPDPVEL